MALRGWGGDPQSSPCGVGKETIYTFLPSDGRFFFSHFKVDFQGFYLLFYVFSNMAI